MFARRPQEARVDRQSTPHNLTAQYPAEALAPGQEEELLGSYLLASIYFIFALVWATRENI